LTGSNYPAINSADVGSLWINSPELADQAAISSVLKDLDQEITAIDDSLTKTIRIKAGHGARVPHRSNPYLTQRRKTI
jgi:type I restriction enzyme S subunit